MKRVLGGILLVVYSIIAITVTVLLLSFNDYNISEIGGYTVYIVQDDALEPEYKQGSILLIKSTNDKNVQPGDEMFLYKVINTQEFEVVNRTLEAKTQQGRHTIYLVEDEESYASDYFIGKASDTIVIEGWGYLLSLLESKWGYLFCVVVVSLLLFLQEVFELVMEIRYGGKNKDGEIAEQAVAADGTVTAKTVKRVTGTKVSASPKTETVKTKSAKTASAKTASAKTGNASAKPKATSTTKKTTTKSATTATTTRASTKSATAAKSTTTAKASTNEGNETE